MLYNVPGPHRRQHGARDHARLGLIKNIVALKDASGNVEQVTQLRALSDIQILSGEDSLTFPILCMGGVGRRVRRGQRDPQADRRDDVRGAVRGELEKGRQIHDRYFELFKNLFIETNPIPVKTALKKMGMYNGEMRLPMCEMSALNEEKLDKTLKACKVL
jgi:4-hydroxy-tetrahydrodipicolinate synthase